MKRRNMVHGIIALFCAVSLYAGPVYATYNEGMEAYLMKDYARAMKNFMYEEDAASLYMVGYLYDHGEGVPNDSAKAVEWYTKAAEKGSVKAMYRLGVMYSNGVGVEKDDATAIMWFKKAAFKGFVPAKDAVKRLEKSSN
ncbi:sel1 repeat family protein [Geomonas nitrogeniifigens]|uniref:Sel1 repeat family protein n=1 Tax=Geomonas diazotrophica TaxID=2843197 RepID=A0ABX8JDM8_9BACT|nr:tetratricopeptide repeat protein [Geomonas nitrogeniifigens]QWV96499.1 sel1 repeat family protein [Geomonas nitrogeniifigens]